MKKTLNMFPFIVFLVFIIGLVIFLISQGIGGCDGNYKAVQKIILPSTEPPVNAPLSILQRYNVVVYQEHTPSCGGTLIANEKEATLVLTACHCVMLSDATPMEFGFIDLDNHQLYRVEVVKFSRRLDLALLQVTDNIPLGLPVAHISSTSPQVGDPIYLLGYGGGVADAFSLGIVSKLKVPDFRGIPRTQFDITGWYGNSGGGLYNVNKELIGVMLSFGPQGARQTGWMHGASLEQIRTFLTTPQQTP